jgi:hypothetical protein
MALLDRIRSRDYALDIASGNVPGSYGINKFGRNTDVDQVVEAIWDGGGTSNYTPTGTWSATAEIDYAVSSSASDTGAIEIQGLDANWDLVIQTVTLTGTTAAALSTNLIRVFRVKNTSATAAVGTIQVGVGSTTSAFTAGNLRAQITIGYDQSLMALYSVPLGKTAYMTNWSASLNKGSGPTSGGVNILLWARTFGGVFRVQDTKSLLVVGTSADRREYNPYPSFAAKTDIVVTAIASANDYDVSAGFDLFLVDD